MKATNHPADLRLVTAGRPTRHRSHVQCRMLTCLMEEHPLIHFVTRLWDTSLVPEVKYKSLWGRARSLVTSERKVTQTQEEVRACPAHTRCLAAVSKNTHLGKPARGQEKLHENRKGNTAWRMVPSFSFESGLEAAPKGQLGAPEPCRMRDMVGKPERTGSASGAHPAAQEGILVENMSGNKRACYCLKKDKFLHSPLPPADFSQDKGCDGWVRILQGIRRSSQ